MFEGPDIFNLPVVDRHHRLAVGHERCRLPADEIDCASRFGREPHLRQQCE